MNISDKELKEGIARDIEAEIKLFCDAVGIPEEGMREMVCVALKTQEMAKELLERREAEQKNLMCWRKGYPEEGGWEDSVAEAIADELSEDGETSEELQLAARVPDRKMRVWLTGGEDRVVNWEWV